MKKLFLLLSTSFTIIVQSQSYFPLRNVETNLSSFSGVNGQWIAVEPTNNILGANYYQGLNFGFDVNNYVSLVNGVATNELYFGRWASGWKGWNRIWHSGNLNNWDTDFTAKTLASKNIYINVPGSQDLINAFTIDVGSFGTNENAARSSYMRVRDIGAGGRDLFTIKGNGFVGIGTPNPSSLLTVAGNISSREIKVTVDAGADFVFEKDYDLPSLESVDQFIKENKHLPEIASAEEMKKEGINLSEMNIKLLQKIEEMTLYMIEMKKQNDIIIKENESLRSNQKLIEKRIQQIENNQ
ncbi:hypothetical protein SAMN02927916_3359 [Flavobacterium anhuiense]|uniref:Cell wall surface anchor family protein n=1 Tax=Flavobacterium anhuiense TaxID=459526 RepID=A0ABY0LY86_9FLAO|nr:hypothetical protein [Flavobacterium anhuiense]SCY78223.1 hypothetical protein SAMN02927916_3359 [Flavobacterium anhuiense]